MNGRKAILCYEAALALRDRCLAKMSEAAADPYLQEERFDPGDASVDIEGNPKNVLDVLYILNAIGIPGCRAR